MLTVEPEDIIECKSWMNLGYHIHDISLDLPTESCVVYCNVENIRDFFQKCNEVDEVFHPSKDPRKFVVISGYSDFGPVVQQEHPVWRDMFKWVQMQPLDELGYKGINVEGRCDSRSCQLTDTYSAKCWSFTALTFPKIPDCVTKWFCVNSLLKHPKVQPIPLGIGEGETELLLKFADDDVDNPYTIPTLLYVNFENYNIDRLVMKEWLLGQYATEEWITIRMECDRPQPDYLQDLADHHFVFCPYGNGIDTYRVWETLYLGSFPVIFDNKGMYDKYSKLPFVKLQHHTSIKESALREVLPTLAHNIIEPEGLSLDEAKLSYWKRQIADAESALLV